MHVTPGKDHIWSLSPTTNKPEQDNLPTLRLEFVVVGKALHNAAHQATRPVPAAPDGEQCDVTNITNSCDLAYFP